MAPITPSPTTPLAFDGGNVDESSAKDGSLGTGAIVGLVVLFFFILLLAVFLMKRRRNTGPNRTAAQRKPISAFNPVYAAPGARLKTEPATSGSPTQPWEAYAKLGRLGTTGSTDTDGTLPRAGGKGSGQDGEHVYTALGVAETRVDDAEPGYSRLDRQGPAAGAAGAKAGHASFGFYQDVSTNAARPASNLRAVFADDQKAKAGEQGPGVDYASVDAPAAYEELTDGGGMYSNPAADTGAPDIGAATAANTAAPSRQTKPPLSFLQPPAEAVPGSDGQFDYTAMSGPGTEAIYAVPAELASVTYQACDPAPQTAHTSPQDRAEAEIWRLKAERRKADDADDEVEVARLSTLIQAIMATQFAVPRMSHSVPDAAASGGPCLPLQFDDGNGADCDYGALPTLTGGDGNHTHAECDNDGDNDGDYAALVKPGMGPPMPRYSAGDGSYAALSGGVARPGGALGSQPGSDDGVYAELGAVDDSSAAATTRTRAAPIYKGMELETQLSRLSAASLPDYAEPTPKDQAEDDSSDPTYACVDLTPGTTAPRAADGTPLGSHVPWADVHDGDGGPMYEAIVPAPALDHSIANEVGPYADFGIAGAVAAVPDVASLDVMYDNHEAAGTPPEATPLA